MRIRFLNSALAGAFVAALHANSPEQVDVGVNFGLDELPVRGQLGPTLIVESDVPNETIDVDLQLDDPAYDRYVTNVAGLAQVVDETLRPFFGTNQTIGLVRGHPAVITPNGIQVGCKQFGQDDIVRIRVALRRLAKGMGFAAFTTTTGHRVDLVSGEFRIDRDGTVSVADVQRVIDTYDANQGQPAKAAYVPFNLQA